MLLVIFAVIVAVVAGVYYLNFIHGRADSPIDLQEIPTGQPGEVTFSDEQIVRLEVQLRDSDPDSRFMAICLLNTAAQKNPEGVGPIQYRNGFG